MARSVTGLFAARGQVDSVDGALRDAGFAPERITIVGPDGQVAPAPGGATARRGVGNWLVEHLVHRGHPQALAEQYHDSIAHEGRWLVAVTIQTDVEDADARNLMVRVGADEISSVADGSMVKVVRPPEGSGQP
ncbi:MAG TPA: hypothetical protein VHB98_05875 [Chloroflexota bacterium]|nr:hypothetical protein [Chloroflexota bacterium]